MLSALPGCGDGGDGNATSKTSPAATESGGTAKPLKFAMVLRDAAAGWAPVLIAGVRDKAKALGVDVVVMDSHNDSLLQIQLMENFLQQKVDGFIYAGSIDQAACNAVVKKYNEAGIPIIALDSAPTGGEILAFVGSDHIEVARKSAESMIKMIKEAHNGEVPEGTIMYLTGALSDDVMRLQDKGFHAVVDQYPQLAFETAEHKWNPDAALSVTANLITKMGDDRPLAVYCMYDDASPGVIKALEAAGWAPEKMIVVTQDAGIGLDYLREGKIKTWSTQRFYQSGLLGVEVMYNFITGAAPVPKVGDEFSAEGYNWTVIECQTGAKGMHVVPEVLVVPWDVSVDDPGDTHNVASRLQKGLSAMP
jgi:ABC-type sugar transport system substrate-binding protein